MSPFAPFCPQRNQATYRSADCRCCPSISVCKTYEEQTRAEGARKASYAGYVSKQQIALGKAPPPRVALRSRGATDGRRFSILPARSASHACRFLPPLALLPTRSHNRAARAVRPDRGLLLAAATARRG